MTDNTNAERQSRFRKRRAADYKKLAAENARLRAENERLRVTAEAYAPGAVDQEPRARGPQTVRLDIHTEPLRNARNIKLQQPARDELSRERFEQEVEKVRAQCRRELEEYKRKLKAESDAQVEEARRKWWEAAAELKEQNELRARTLDQWMTEEEFKNILGCLHPDRVPDEAKERYHKAFIKFNELKCRVERDGRKLRARGWTKPKA